MVKGRTVNVSNCQFVDKAFSADPFFILLIASSYKPLRSVLLFIQLSDSNHSFSWKHQVLILSNILHLPFIVPSTLTWHVYFTWAYFNHMLPLFYQSFFFNTLTFYQLVRASVFAYFIISNSQDFYSVTGTTE